MRVASHALHAAAEALLGVLAIALLALCALVWRLAQGPVDITWLIQREHARLAIPGTRLAIGGADLAWRGYDAAGRPIDISLRRVTLAAPGEGPKAQVRLAHVGLLVLPLLQGRLAPSSITVQGGAVQLHRKADGSLDLGAPDGTMERPAPGTLPAWPPQLQHLRIEDASVAMHDAALGLDWRAAASNIVLDRTADGGTAGQAQAELAAGEVHARLVVQAAISSVGSHVTATLTPVSPAALARLSPALAGLAAIDAPVGVGASAELDRTLQPVAARFNLAMGPGTVAAGQGGVPVTEGAATLSVNLAPGPDSFQLEQCRVALAPARAAGAGPVITATAHGVRDAGRVKGAFEVAIDALDMTDLDRYWPAGTGGGARSWLVQNVIAGRAYNAHVAGTLKAASDLSDASVTALSGGLAFDDASFYWLKPVPPVVRARGRMDIEGPDALRVTLQAGQQDRLALTPGSFIRITGLQAAHQLGDIDVGLSGPLADLLHILNQPRLKLLSRGGVDIVDPAGAMQAHMTLHVPLEDRVTMDDIPVAASATLTGVHLGRIVGGRDLDHAALAVKVTGDGLGITGRGSVAGIEAKLALAMDFRAGPPGQVLQHLTAEGRASPRQLAAAGLPLAAVRILTGGTTGLRADYVARRDASAALQVDADLTQASVTTPFGWSKAAGPAAKAGGLVLLQHGLLSGVDNLHAEGPGLAIVSRAIVDDHHARVLRLDRFDVGRTSAHGQIGFPGRSGDPISVDISGPMLDLSSYLAAPAAKSKPRADSPDDPDKPGVPWSAKLAFGRVMLAQGTMLAPLRVDAASDGTRILHAAANAGDAGQLAATIAPSPDGRSVSLVAANAGLVLRALGVADNLQGGALKLDGSFDDHQAGSPLSGTATLNAFNLRDAPAIGRLLQVMTLYGVADTLHGPGLHFSKLVAPFVWQKRVLHLSSARAFSSSLGVTAAGDIDLRHRVVDMRGTVVPAYFFNQLLGDLPLIGRIFSPEKGGGLFAARYSVRGPLANPKVGVNPLSALTPGFLREGFGIFDRKGPPSYTGQRIF